jgi:hypothetical protein
MMDQKNVLPTNEVENGRSNKVTSTLLYSFPEMPLSKSGALKVLDSLQFGGFVLDGQGRGTALNFLSLAYLDNGLLLSGDRLTAADRGGTTSCSRPFIWH